MEILDYILNRYLGSPYSPRKLYYLCLEETKPRTRKYADNISSAMDYGTNEDVQRAVLDFMKTQKYDSMLDRNKVENWILTEDWIREDVDSRRVKDAKDNYKEFVGSYLHNFRKAIGYNTYFIPLNSSYYDDYALYKFIPNKYDENGVSKEIYVETDKEGIITKIEEKEIKLFPDSRRVKDDNNPISVYFVGIDSWGRLTFYSPDTDYFYMAVESANGSPNHEVRDFFHTLDNDNRDKKGNEKKVLDWDKTHGFVLVKKGEYFDSEPHGGSPINYELVANVPDSRKVNDMIKVKDNLFDNIDKDLAKLGKISRFYSDDDNITITTDYNTYKVNRSMLDGIMGDYGYEFYDYGDNGDKVMLTYNKVSDSRKVKDDYYNPYHRELFSYEAMADGDNVVVNGEKYMPIEHDREFTVKMLKTKIKSYMSAKKFADWLMEVRETDEDGLTRDPLNNLKLEIFKHIMANGQRYMGGGISDSRRVKDTDDEYLLQEIARQLEEGYYAGYEPQWDIDITVDGMDISEFDDYDQDLIYRDIAYVVKDGYDNYMGIQTELSDGSIVYVDFVLNY